WRSGTRCPSTCKTSWWRRPASIPGTSTRTSKRRTSRPGRSTRPRGSRSSGSPTRTSRSSGGTPSPCGSSGRRKTRGPGSPSPPSSPSCVRSASGTFRTTSSSTSTARRSSASKQVEFAALAEQQERFDRMGCDIVTVSTDTQFSHLAWQRNEKELANVKYQMGADPTGKVSRMFGVYDEATGLDLRGTFIINPEGKLLKANIYMGKKSNEVCPSK